MGKGIVIYSSYFPDDEQLFRGVEFLEKMRDVFYDYKLYIGVQYSTNYHWIDVIEKYKDYGLDIRYGIVDEKLSINSDVSGYQKALELLYRDKKNIQGDFIWFGHSKGSTSGVRTYHDFVMKNFWGNREQIERRLNDNGRLGCYGNYLSFLPQYDLDKISKIWKNYSDFESYKPPIPYMFTNTFFVVKLHIFLIMFDSIKKKFFNEKLKGMFGEGDRYFFERDFIHFVDMLGYEPLFDDVAPNITWRNANKQDFQNYMVKWS